MSANFPSGRPLSPVLKGFEGQSILNNRPKQNTQNGSPNRSYLAT
ncbi:hypothetical protein EVA_14548 [gut metagenome]|uniref:Uncharacterized protein n=1 Tax=gut metagenome TaxID=749906 RepID=J9CBL5_9ZZZZ